MKNLAFVVLALASQNAMARTWENTLISTADTESFQRMHRTDCQVKNIRVHVESKTACSDIEGTWVSEVIRK